MKKITDKDVEALKAGKKVTKGFIHMQLDDKGKLNLWSDINITDNYRSLKIDANKLFDQRVVVNTNDYITSYPASLFDMSIKEGEDIAKDHFDNIIAIELYR